MHIIQPLIMAIPCLLIKLVILVGGRFFVGGGQAENYDVLVVMIFEDLLELGESHDCLDPVRLDGFV